MRITTLIIALVFCGLVTQASANKILSTRNFFPKKTISATITAYTPDPRENGGPGTKSGTAIGTRIRPGIVAVSRDLLRSGWDFGDRVHIKGLGVFIIEDTMHQRFRRTIDVAVTDRNAARKIGVQRHIVVTLLEKADRPDS